jgi:putative nucleotidyltransferase with HDIG domain
VTLAWQAWRRRLWPAVVAGISLGIGFSFLSEGPVWLLAGLLAMAVASEWIEVRLGNLGSVTLRPVIAFVALWHSGVGGYLLVGLLPILIVRGLNLKGIRSAILPLVGREAISLWSGYLAYSVISSLMGNFGLGQAAHAAVRAVSMLVFWTASLGLQAALLPPEEGLGFRPAFAQLATRAWPHALALTGVAVLLGYISVGFGFVITGLTVIVLIEAYYPWKLLGEQEGVLITSLQMMAQAVDLKDPYTSNHSQQVARRAVRLARTMGLPESEVERIRMGALMHDIGKIGISGRIIRKPGKLTEEEMAMMRQHSSVSASIIGPLEILGEAAQMVRHHHERWDGAGYPDGLRGESIPLGSRIIFVSDAFDALVSDRPYRKGATKAGALNEIRKHSGTQFDPEVVRALERIIDTF